MGGPSSSPKGKEINCIIEYVTCLFINQKNGGDGIKPSSFFFSFLFFGQCGRQDMRSPLNTKSCQSKG